MAAVNPCRPCGQVQSVHGGLFQERDVDRREEAFGCLAGFVGDADCDLGETVVLRDRTPGRELEDQLSWLPGYVVQAVAVDEAGDVHPVEGDCPAARRGT